MSGNMAVKSWGENARKKGKIFDRYILLGIKDIA